MPCWFDCKRWSVEAQNVKSLTLVTTLRSLHLLRSSYKKWSKNRLIPALSRLTSTLYFWHLKSTFFGVVAVTDQRVYNILYQIITIGHDEAQGDSTTHNPRLDVRWQQPESKTEWPFPPWIKYEQNNSRSSWRSLPYQTCMRDVGILRSSARTTKPLWTWNFDCIHGKGLILQDRSSRSRRSSSIAHREHDQWCARWNRPSNMRG